MDIPFLLYMLFGLVIRDVNGMMSVDNNIVSESGGGSYKFFKLRSSDCPGFFVHPIMSFNPAITRTTASRR
jgi:hypothetical protein